jgi:FkbM family methyltransferase
MTFISYAQNCEDVILKRALQSVDKGFYLDVGAQDPIEHSVTKAFYESGWSGINIEPTQEYYQKLVDDRPKDINLKIAASDKNGQLELYEIPHTGLTTSNAEYAQQHHADINFSALGSNTITIECQTLDQICKLHQVEVIHFLKIDVEGHEKQVIEGFSFKKVRPWILVIEATAPNRDIDVSERWHDIVVSYQYKYVYFDGLNKYYLAIEKLELEKYFNSPANVFDGYIHYNEYFLQQERARLEQERARLEQDNKQAQSQIQALLSSTSWRITAPLRWLAGWFK